MIDADVGAAKLDVLGGLAHGVDAGLPRRDTVGARVDRRGRDRQTRTILLPQVRQGEVAVTSSASGDDDGEAAGEKAGEEAATRHRGTVAVTEPSAAALRRRVSNLRIVR